MVNFFMSNKNFGFEEIIVTNRDKHSPINSLLSRIFGINSSYDPS